MIYSLNGKLVAKKSTFAIVDVGGVGYKVVMAEKSLREMGSAGDAVQLFCSFSIKQDGEVSLLGFVSEKELEMFELLRTVNGIGPKSALAILSNVKIPEIIASVSEGNPALLKKVSGIGEKTAQRIVLELKDKINALGAYESKELMSKMESDSDLEAVLLEMGYRKPEIRMTVSKIDPVLIKLEDRLRSALKLLQKRSQ